MASSSATAGKAIRCKAAVAWAAGEPLKIEEVEVAPPQKDEVRIKVLYTALCHTDLVFWEAKGLTPIFPRILGHEAAGIVESVGEGVQGLQPGDAVLPVFTGECGQCRHCKSEESNMCHLLRIAPDRDVMISGEGGSRFKLADGSGKTLAHFLGTSTFSQYTVVHAGCVAKIHPSAPLETVCVLSCGVATGMGAMVNCARPKEGSSVAVFGLGTLGLAAAEGARIAGAAQIIGVDVNSARFERARNFGCTHFVNAAEVNAAQVIVEQLTEGGVDAAVECSGSNKAMVQAFECIHDGWGKAVLTGVPMSDYLFTAKPYAFLEERTITGSFFGNYKPRTHLPGLVDLYMSKKLELEKFITHRVNLPEINDAFRLMKEGESLRCVVSMFHD